MSAEAAAVGRYPDNGSVATVRFTLPAGAAYGEDALFLDGRTTREEWVALILELEGVGTMSQWMLGDALAWGEGRFGEEIYEWAERVTGRARVTLRSYAWVSRKVPVRRRAPLPWSFHQVVAAEDPERQVELLGRALRYGYTKRQLLEQRDGPVALPRRLSVEHSCPRCDYGWSGQGRPAGAVLTDGREKWPNPELVSPREVLARISEEVPEARELAQRGLEALDRYPEQYRCPRCAFAWNGDPGAKPELPHVAPSPEEATEVPPAS